MTRTTPARALSALPCFPASLTPAERRAIEAVMAHDTAADAAAAIGLSVETLRCHTQAARQKAGVSSTLRLAVLYLNAQRETAS